MPGIERINPNDDFNRTVMGLTVNAGSSRAGATYLAVQRLRQKFREARP
jgi:hypothetical protein